MKPLYPLKTFSLLILSISVTHGVNAQATLEFASGSGPAGNGSSITNQVAIFQDNTNNPSGNTFTPFTTPTTTATFSLSDQQYSVPGTWIPSNVTLVFGGTDNTRFQSLVPSALFPVMSSVGGASDNNFTSLGPPQAAGTGISVANNYGVELFNSAMGLYSNGSPTTGRYYCATLTITFSSPLTNPVLHVVGLGAIVGGRTGNLGMSTEFDLQTPGITLSELSGSPELRVNSSQILNSAAHPTATTGSGAASGSILVTGSTISSLVFKVYLRGDGGLTTWSTTTEHTGDAFIIGVSSLVATLVLPVTVHDFTAVAQTNQTTQLQWTMGGGASAGFFDVEYSQDQSAWQSIGIVQSAGNDNNGQSYNFIHTNPATGSNYYRLKQVDKEGNFTYSSIRTVFFANAIQLNFYPNPTIDRVVITGSQASLGSVSVMTIDGRQLQENNNFFSGGSIDLSRYPAGIYLLGIRGISGNTQVLKILKN
jgi:Secretion system C-terminal sorting domain